jgi:hypothetical protein
MGIERGQGENIQPNHTNLLIVFGGAEFKQISFKAGFT